MRAINLTTHFIPPTKMPHRTMMTVQTFFWGAVGGHNGQKNVNNN